MGLFFLLANTLLVLILIYALRFPIILLGVILWKLRYILLGLAALLMVFFVWGYHNETVANRTWTAAHPYVYHDSVKEWDDAHPEVFVKQ